MELIVEMKEYWGDDALLVPFNDFEKVCNKYNLTCGLFEEYTGHVPTDKIGKISEIQRKLKDAGNYWIGYDGVIKKLYRIVEAKLWGYYYEITRHIYVNALIELILYFLLLTAQTTTVII